MSLKRELWDIINSRFVVFLFGLLLSGSLGSKIFTGDWFEWFSLVHRNVWLGVGIVFLAWFLLRYSKSYHKKINRTSNVFSFSRYGYKKIGEESIYDVLWNVIAPYDQPYHTEPNITPKRIRVEGEPLCPVCITKLEQSETFWGGYVWRCVRCKFRKYSRWSFGKANEHVEKIAQRDVEKHFFESNKPA